VISKGEAGDKLWCLQVTNGNRTETTVVSNCATWKPCGGASGYSRESRKYWVTKEFQVVAKGDTVLAWVDIQWNINEKRKRESTGEDRSQRATAGRPKEIW